MAKHPPKSPSKGGPKGAPHRPGSRSEGPRAKGPRPQGAYSPNPGLKGARGSARGQSERPVSEPRGRGEGIWLYGHHAVRAALENPRRRVKRAVLTARAAEELGATLLSRVRCETTDMDGVSKVLPQGAVHQGVALLCEALPGLVLADVLKPSERRRIVLVLDQISDPHNEGAILRTAAAFGVAAVVVQDRNSAAESGALAKAASGALDIIPIVSVVNISRALEELEKLGFWRVALAGDGESPLKEAVAGEQDIALVLGSEGSGIRRLVREHCDTAAYVPIDSAMESLNVSNAAAVSLYELRRG